MFDTKQTCALVTGANRGLGLKFCEGLVGAGVDDRDEFYASLQKRWDARVAPIQAPPALQQF